MGNYKKLNASEAVYIQVLESVGMSKIDISRLFNYKYMDVVNVLRGHCYNSVTGILQLDIPTDKAIEVTHYLQQGLTYVEAAAQAGVEPNKARIIKGYLKFKGLIPA